jgi:hypothetical protein
MEDRIQYLKNKLEKMEYFYGAYPRTSWPGDWLRNERETIEELEFLLEKQNKDQAAKGE